MAAEPPVLEARALSKVYSTRRGLRRQAGQVHAVTGIDLAVSAGETVAVIGESGCGKSTIAKMLLALEAPTSGSVLFDGVDLTELRGTAFKGYRRSVQAVLQDPYSSLPPRMVTRDAVAEPLKVMLSMTRQDRSARLAELFDQVGLDAETHGGRYPHELSGGQLQRVAIAKALAPGSRMLVLDEPVSSLDVSVRAQVMNLLADLQDQLGLAYLLISHDLGGVRHLSDRVYVMYLGAAVEVGTTGEVFSAPRHPYTRALLTAAAPAQPGDEEAPVLSGELPSPYDVIPGCAFCPRCPEAFSPCLDTAPLLTQRAGREVACHLSAPDLATVSSRSEKTTP